MLSTSPTRAEGKTPIHRPASLSVLNKILISLLLLLVVVACLLLITTIVLAVLYAIERNKTKDLQMMQKMTTTTTAAPTTTVISIVNDSDLCLTPYCIRAANALFQSIDETVNPRENFYEFTCGTFLKNTKIPTGENVQNRITELQTQLNNAVIDLFTSPTSNRSVESHAITNARRLYAACVDEEANKTNTTSELLQFINTEFGGWPILQGSTWDNSTFDFNKLLVKLDEYRHFIFYLVYTYTKNNELFDCIVIGQSNLGLGNRHFYEEESNTTIAYRQRIRNLALSLTNDTSRIDDDVNDIFQFEKTIAKYFYTYDELDLESVIQTTVGNLSSAINSSFDFTDYLRRLYRFANSTLYDTDCVNASALNVLYYIPLIIDQQSSRTIQNYMIWRFMMDQTSLFPTEIQTITEQPEKDFQVINAQSEGTCSEYVMRNMNFVVSKLYIDEYFDRNSQNEAQEIGENMRKSFIGILNQSTWMDPVSQSKSIEKAQDIYEEVGYPDYLDDDNLTQLEENYAEYNFTSSYVVNGLILNRIYRKRNLRISREAINRSTWVDDPLGVDGFYNPLLNTISVQLGLIQPYYFNKNAPNYLNYAGIGAVIAHEITHGFDNFGGQYDKDGNLVAWWTNETIEAFNQRKQCIIDQYSNYTVTQVDLKINGAQAQGESIADNGGLRSAFFAYQKWAQTHSHVDKKLPGLSKYSAEQMFFMNFGYSYCSKYTDAYLRNAVLTQTHPPSQFRILGSTSNFAEFDRVFNCTPGQGNSRLNKCIVW